MELAESLDNVGTRKALVEELRPYVEKVNLQCHEAVQILLGRVVIASKEKPFITTIKGRVARLQTLNLYEDEIAALFP